MQILQLLGQSPILALVFLLAIVLAITVHEFAHAWTAYRLGDDTPRLQGRVSLNPAVHLDPLGSLSFIFLGFGWGKPVIYNPIRLLKRYDELLIALAGPGSNLVFALFLNALALVFKPLTGNYSDFLRLAAEINVLLAAFNIIPFPPLDGSSIVAYFWPEYRSVIGGQIGLLFLLFLIFSGALNLILNPVIFVFSTLTSLFGIL